ncbi:MAG: acyltransferase domain-containing protein [Gallionella sp.]
MTLAIFCSGQGAQHAAMLDIVQHDQQAAEIIAAGESVLGYSLRGVLARKEQMFRNVIAQPLICLTQLAIWTALRKSLPKPAAFCGYSVGELGAYACAGALDACALAQLATSRAELMDHAAVTAHGGLLAIQGLSRSDLRQLCAGKAAWISIAIGADEFVVGGEDAVLAALTASCAARGAAVTRLKVGLASHTPLLSTAVQPFREVLDRSSFGMPESTVVAGVDATWVLHRDTAVEKLAVQLDRTIEWMDCLDVLYERGCRVFLELGPGRALTRMVLARHGQVAARAVDDFRSLSGIITWLDKQTRDC